MDTKYDANLSPGLTVYSRIKHPTNGKWWNGTSFETYNAAHWSQYALAMTEDGASGVYSRDFPAGITDAGSYPYFVYVQQGASPSESDAPAVNTGTVQWNGSSISNDVSVLVGTSIMLVSLADVKLMFGISGNGDDSLLNLIIYKVSRRIESFCKRTFTDTGANVVEKPRGGSAVLEPMRFPIISIESIVEDSDRVFTGVEAVDSSNYYNDGRYIWRTDGGKWEVSPGAIQLTYRGGYALVSDVDDALKSAALLQIGFIYQRRQKLAFNSVTGGDGSVSTLTEIDLLPEVRKTLMPFRRNVLNV